MHKTRPAAWKTLKTETSFEHPVLKVETCLREHPTKGCHEFVLLHSAPWVNVIAITEDEQVVLIRQWRHGIADYTLEIPGGLVDPGEEPLKAGVRELMEETGYSPGEVKPLGWVHPNSAIFGNRCHTILVEGARRTSEQRLDEAEDIEVVLRPLKDLPLMVSEGKITHSLVISALGLFWLKRGNCK